MAEQPLNQGPPPPNEGRPRSRSKVWEFFDEVVVVQDGVEVVKAKCKWPGCSSHLSIGWGGVGHLIRHHHNHKRVLAQNQAEDGGGSDVDDF